MESTALFLGDDFLDALEGVFPGVGDGFEPGPSGSLEDLVSWNTLSSGDALLGIVCMMGIPFNHR